MGKKETLEEAQARADAAEDGLFRVVKALGFDTDGAKSASGFFGPLTMIHDGQSLTTPWDIAVGYATQYREEVEGEIDAHERRFIDHVEDEMLDHAVARIRHEIARAQSHDPDGVVFRLHPADIEVVISAAYKALEPVGSES